MDNSWISRRGIMYVPHFGDQARLRNIDTRLLRQGLGLDILAITGDHTVNCRRPEWAQAKLGLITPEVGQPVHIGRHFPEKGDERDTLLVKLPNGQRVHVVAAFKHQRVDFITLWCPDDPDNQMCWHPHALLPTQAGARTLPPTRWFLGDPMRANANVDGAR